MKNLNIISFILFLLLTLSLFTSCDKEEFETIELIDETTTNPDTIIISEELVFKFEGSDEETFNGISLNCPNPDSNEDNYINVIAYGRDLVVSEDGSSVEYNDDFFVFVWETEDEIQPGTYQAFVTIETEGDFVEETTAEITITEVTDTYTYGTFSGRYVTHDQELVQFSGSFNVSQYDCALFGDDLPEVDDYEAIFSTGVTVLEFGMGNQETINSIYLDCTEIFEEEEGIKHIQLIADAFLVDEEDIDEIIGARFFTYHRELQDLEFNKEYDVRFGTIDEDMTDPFSMGEAHVISTTDQITVIYTGIEGLFISGEFYGQYNGSELKGTFKSQIFDCE